MTWWIWVVLALALLVAEFVTTTMHVGFFAIGALVVAAIEGFGGGLPLWAELLIFTITSLFALLIGRPIVMRKLKLDQTPTVDTMVGEQAVALEAIAPSALGKAEMRGTTWTARNVGNEPLAAGQRGVVERVEGLVLLLRSSS